MPVLLCSFAASAPVVLCCQWSFAASALVVLFFYPDSGAVLLFRSPDIRSTETPDTRRSDAVLLLRRPKPVIAQSPKL